MLYHHPAHRHQDHDPHPRDGQLVSARLVDQGALDGFGQLGS